LVEFNEQFGQNEMTGFQGGHICIKENIGVYKDILKKSGGYDDVDNFDKIEVIIVGLQVGLLEYDNEIYGYGIVRS
jgi:hypothetical protein